MCDAHFEQVSRALNNGSTGNEAFTLLLRLLSSSLDTSYEGESIERLLTFKVPVNTPFDQYLKDFRTLISVTVDGGRELAPTPEMVMSLFRSNMGRQYPSLMPSVFTGDAATAAVPFANLDEMWSRLDGLRTNRTQAVEPPQTRQDGSISTFSHHSTPGNYPETLLTQNPPVSRTQASKKPTQPAWVPDSMTSAGEVMITTPVQTPDAFASRFPSWPLANEIWPEVFNVSTSMNNHDPPLWARDVEPNIRSELIRDCKNKCLNCGVWFDTQTGYSADGRIPMHSMRTCEAPFTNAFGVLNNIFHDQQYAACWPTWQARMRSYRRPQSCDARTQNNRPKRGNRFYGDDSRYHNPKYQTNYYQTRPTDSVPRLTQSDPANTQPQNQVQSQDGRRPLLIAPGPTGPPRQEDTQQPNPDAHRTT